MNFATNGDTTNEPSGSEGVLCRRDGTEVVCVRCQGNHYANRCPDKKKNPKYPKLSIDATGTANATTTNSVTSDANSGRPPVDVITGQSHVTTSDTD